MRVNTLISAAFLSLATGFVLAFPAGVVMSDADVLVDGKGVVLYTFEIDHEGASSCNSGARFDRDYSLFNRGDSSETVGL